MMKKILVFLFALALLCGCSPKLYNNIKADSVPASHPDYAVIYFYRPGGFVQTPYTVHLGDQPVFRSKNKAKAAVKVETPGEYEIWAATESRESIVLKVEPGQEYYVKTITKFGVALWRPLIELMAPQAGKADWDAIR